MVWTVLGAAGVWDSINQTVQDIVGGESAGDFDVENYIGTSRVLGFTMLVAVVDVVLLITAIATLGAFLYNMAAALLGGIEVTLAEDRLTARSAPRSRFVARSCAWGNVPSGRPAAASWHASAPGL